MNDKQRINRILAQASLDISAIRGIPTAVTFCNLYSEEKMRKTPEPDFEKVVAAACAVWGVAPLKFIKKLECRERLYLFPRHFVCKFLYEHNGWTLSAIGRKLQKDHSTIKSAISVLDELMIHKSFREKWGAMLDIMHSEAKVIEIQPGKAQEGAA